MFGKFSTVTNPLHKTTYPSISPLRPELSQAGKTVLITGGNSGIGYAIAQSFIQASASKVIILGRRADVVASAAKRLEEATGEGQVVLGLSCDIGDATAVEALWEKLHNEKTIVDVLVLNASAFPAHKPLLELGTGEVWAAYDLNVRAQLQLTETFYKQGGKNLVNISTACIHEFENAGQNYLSYGLTKHACQLTLQLIAQDTAPEKMQIVSFHPGAVFTDSAKAAGWSEDLDIWDNANLPGNFAVWAASPEAKFLHGRFVWAAWDVEQLKSGELRKRIDEDSTFLKLGVNL
ncbi:NAD(P)-binding protein [Poronia punctata]|nr:NAD(P)-binding protein [Poronia punctata]